MIEIDGLGPLLAIKRDHVLRPHGPNGTPPEGMCRAKGNEDPSRVVDGQTRQSVIRRRMGAALGGLVGLARKRALGVGIARVSIELAAGDVRARRGDTDESLVDR